MIASSTVNIQTGYAHKTFGLSGIGVSIGANGAPSFFASFGTLITPYVARAVTILY